MEAGANLRATVLMKIQMRSLESSIFAACFDAADLEDYGGRSIGSSGNGSWVVDGHKFLCLISFFGETTVL